MARDTIARCVAVTLLFTSFYIVYSGTTLPRALRLPQQNALAECDEALMGGAAKQHMQQMQVACSIEPLARGSNIDACCAAGRRALDHCLCDETMYKSLTSGKDASQMEFVMQTCNIPNIGAGNC